MKKIKKENKGDHFTLKIQKKGVKGGIVSGSSRIIPIDETVKKGKKNV